MTKYVHSISFFLIGFSIIAGATNATANKGGRGQAVLFDLGTPLVWDSQLGLVWDLDTACWRRSPENKPEKFTNGSPVVLNITGEQMLTVLKDITPGRVAVKGHGNLILAGEKLRGEAEIIKEGDSTLEIGGNGFENQPLTVKGGILKIGQNAAPDALGGSNAILRVENGGTLDINYSGSVDMDPEKSRITHGKTIELQGNGHNGMGALMNSGKESSAAFSSIRLNGDTTINCDNGLGLAILKGGSYTGRPNLTASDSTTLTLTATDPVGDEECLSLENADVTVGKIRCKNGVGLKIGGATAINTEQGIEFEDKGKLLLNSTSSSFTFPLHFSGKTGFLISSVNNDLYMPIMIDPGTRLEVGMSKFYFRRSVTGDGTFVIKKGDICFIDDPDSDSYADLPRNVVLSGGNFCVIPIRDRSYNNLTITNEGNGAFFPCYTKAPYLATFENCRTDVLQIQLGSTYSYGQAAFGKGSVIHVNGDIRLGEKNRAFLALHDGAEMTVKGTLVMGRQPSQGLTEFYMDGGVLNHTNVYIQIGYDNNHSLFTLDGGVLNAMGIGARPMGKNFPSSMDHTALFCMNGGTVHLGKLGFPKSSDGYPYTLANFYLGNGDLNATADFRCGLFDHFMFDSYLTESEGTFTLNTAGHDITFPTALQGNSDVRITGNGNFTADNGVYGGINGHWTIEKNGGPVILANAGSLLGGLTLAEGCSCEVDIRGSEESRVSLGVYSSWRWDKRAVFCEFMRPYEWTTHRMHDLLTRKDAEKYTVYAFQGEFNVTDPGIYHFASSFYNELTLWIDGEKICHNSAGDKELGMGWHTFKITGNCNSRGDNGPKGEEWVKKNMSVGFFKKSNAGDPDPAVADLTPFDTDVFAMRPAPTLRHRKIAPPANLQNVREVYDALSLTDSLKMINNAQWKPVAGSTNIFSGWFKVEPGRAGTWNFIGTYGEGLLLSVDNKSLFYANDGNPSEATIDLTEGWHPFSLTLCGKKSEQSEEGSPLSFRTGEEGYHPFDEDHLRLSFSPAGLIGGEIKLAAGSKLSNRADKAASVVGNVSGTGTLSGKFKFEGGSLSIDGAEGRERQLPTIRFEDPTVDALAKLGRIKVNFIQPPPRYSYRIGPALGLAPGQSNCRLETTVAGKPYGKLKLFVNEGDIYLKNMAKEGSLLILK